MQWTCQLVAKTGRGRVGPSPGSNFVSGEFSTPTGCLHLYGVATIAVHVLLLKCGIFHFGWGSAPDPARESYSAPQTL